MIKDNNSISSSGHHEVSKNDSPALSRWHPVTGSETKALLDHLRIPEESRQQVEREASSILAQCVPPTEARGTDTGLVIGYIQSGKTMSFTTVAALARDNRYRLLIVITGITTNLFEQSSDRIEQDLRLRTRADRTWLFHRNPKCRPENIQQIRMALDWDHDLPGYEKRTVLITVMKNSVRLDHLIKLLGMLNLQGVPTLVIDDEADQASLNNQIRKGLESATYRRITQLRRLLPQHTFLQYTATPQALLLINLIDVLSPSFAALLTPGVDYTGGQEFFEGDFQLVRRIPSRDVPTKSMPLTEPPESLLEALRVYFLGVAVGLAGGAKGNRSMLVHPSKETMQHASYAAWIRQIQNLWSRILERRSMDLDRQDLLKDFSFSYEDLSKTADNLPPFSEIEHYLYSAVKGSNPIELNAAHGKTPDVEWYQDYARILVGGEVLNRGYTVEGLTVTYMPRGKGVGNADTIQQRARWFGYKAEYLGYCRVYLTDETLHAYESYVNHEESMRNQLRQHAATNRPLREWRRKFFLSPDLRPTRHDVLDLDYMRGNFANAWYESRAPHDSEEAVRTNRDLVDRFRASVSFRLDEGHSMRTEAQKHLVASSLSLDLVYRELLTQFRVTRLGDSQRYTGLLLQLASTLEQGDQPCSVYYMSGGALRERTVDEGDEIPNLFQGPHPDKTGVIYPGDRHIKADLGVTVQIHNLRVKTESKVLAEHVPAIAVWVPREMSSDWIVQNQGGP